VSDQSQTPESAREPATEQITEAAAAAPSAAAPEAALTAPAPEPEPPVAIPPTPPNESGEASAANRPEVAVGAAFAGGFALAMILKRLAR
jgi:hypothetical protein